MACEKCEQAGKAPKIIHFARCGRWDTRVFCEHTYKKGKLTAHNKEFGERKRIHHVASEEETKIKRCPPLGPRVKYSREMDQWIVRNYHPSNKHDFSYGSGQMKKMAKAFDAEFSTRGTRPNQIIGRWNRLRKDGFVAKQVRQVPSLPRLKFMEGPNV